VSAYEPALYRPGEEVFYKLARPDGWDWFTGQTINYREAVGGIVTVPHEYGEGEVPVLCSENVLHACRDPNRCFIGAELPCSVYEVSGHPVVDDGEKQGFKELRVIREVPSEELDGLFGWRIVEAMNPVNPFKLKPPEITSEHIALLRRWASVRDSTWDSVRDSVRDSVWDSVGASVWASVGASVWDSVRDSTWDSVWDSVGDSVRDSVWDSVGASVWAYIGSLFPHVRKWAHVVHEEGVYPFQAAADLWRMGLVPSFDGRTWRLHGGPDGRVLYEEKEG